MYKNKWENYFVQDCILLQTKLNFHTRLWSNSDKILLVLECLSECHKGLLTSFFNHITATTHDKSTEREIWFTGGKPLYTRLRVTSVELEKLATLIIPEMEIDEIHTHNMRMNRQSKETLTMMTIIFTYGRSDCNFSCTTETREKSLTVLLNCSRTLHYLDWAVPTVWMH